MKVKLKDKSIIEISTYDNNFNNITINGYAYDVFNSLDDKKLMKIDVLDDENIVVATFKNKHCESISFNGATSTIYFKTIDDLESRVDSNEDELIEIQETILELYELIGGGR